MNDFDGVKKALETIRKKGDLYDILSLKGHKESSINGFTLFHLWVFSRLLTCGAFAFFKVCSLFVDVEKIQKAQEKVRSSLGVLVDVVRFSNNYKFFFQELPFTKKYSLALWYEMHGREDTYIDDLKKISSFLTLYKIPYVLLNVEDVKSFFKESVSDDLLGISWLEQQVFEDHNHFKISKEQIKKLQKYFGFSYKMEKDMDVTLLCVDAPLLKIFIQNMEYRIDKDFLLEFREKIEDILVKQAIDAYLENRNLKKLKEVVHQRFTLVLNNEGSYRTKNMGKVMQHIQLVNEYVCIASRNQKGDLLENRTMSLTDYLGVKDSQELFWKAENRLEEREFLYLASFYSYLCKNFLKENSSCKEKKTIYDYYYEAFLNKQNISGIFLNKAIFKKSIHDSFFLTLVICLFLLCVDEIRMSTVLREKQDLKEKLYTEMILEGYKKSYELEEKLFLSLANPLLEKVSQKLTQYFSDSNVYKDFDSFTISGKTGDIPSGRSQNVIATVTPLKDNISLPQYYAYSYAQDAYYENGSVEYLLTHFDGFRLTDSDPLFEVSYEISPTELNRAIAKGNMNFINHLYPVDGSYVLSSVRIYDKYKPDEVFVWNIERQMRSSILEEEEMELLLSFKNPKICCVYGVSEELLNPFVKFINNNILFQEIGKLYFSLETREAIIKGLGLDADVSNEEIFEQIKNKKYSTTPILDASLTKDLKKMDKVSYYEAIASMDSLVCSLAASLAVNVDEDLCYVVGFLNQEDQFISLDESHAWAMYPNGEIVDVTPSDSANFVSDMEKVVAFSHSYYLPLSLVFVLLSFMFKKKYGKKIVFRLEMKRVENILTTSDLEALYAKMNRIFYGGIFIPRKRSRASFVDVISNDFYSYSKEELEEMKEILNNSKKLDLNQRFLSLELMDKIPFILENKEELKRRLKKDL